MLVAPVASSVRVGLDTLRANPLRTVLSVLGVVIGVAALVAVLAVGDGMESVGRAQIEAEGMHVIAIQPRTTREIDGIAVPRDSYPVFHGRDAVALAAALPPDAQVTMQLDGQALVEGPNAGRPRGVFVTGLLPSRDYPRMTLAHGRLFTADEAHAGAAVAVLSHRLATELAAPDSAVALLRRTVRVGGAVRQVVGIAASRGVDDRLLAAYVPLDSASAVMLPSTRPRVPQIMVHAASLERVAAVKADVERWAAGRWHDWREQVRISTARAERLEQLQSGVLMFKLFMGAITSIALIVGGIGIMNVLLASVTERTREIGIRKTAGARHRDILVQFLAESVVVSGAGSLIGAILGATAALAITAVMRARAHMPIHAAVSWTTLAIAALAAVALGLIFGTYPALRAASLSPIDAIRHE